MTQKTIIDVIRGELDIDPSLSQTEVIAAAVQDLGIDVSKAGTLKQKIKIIAGEMEIDTSGF